MSDDVQNIWTELYTSTLNKNDKLIEIKDEFVNILNGDVNPFVKQINEFIEDFKINGPGAFADNLEVGQQLMNKYERIIFELERKKVVLIDAEILFDVPLTDYSDFDKVQIDFKNYQLIYNLYNEQKAARDNWAHTLWIDLNPQILIEGMIFKYSQAFDFIVSKFKNIFQIRN